MELGILLKLIKTQLLQRMTPYLTSAIYIKNGYHDQVTSVCNHLLRLIHDDGRDEKLASSLLQQL